MAGIDESRFHMNRKDLHLILNFIKNIVILCKKFLYITVLLLYCAL